LAEVDVTLAPEALGPVVLVQQHRRVLAVVTLLVLQLDMDLTEEHTEAMQTTTLVIMESAAAEEQEGMVALGLPSKVETEALVEQTCLVYHEAEEAVVTHTEMAEGLASRSVVARVAATEPTTTLDAIPLVPVQRTMALVAVRTGMNVEARMLVALES
jgi:hypothetical protein